MADSVPEPQYSLLGLLLTAPLIAVNPRKINVLHGVDMEGIHLKRTTVDAACGKQRLKVLTMPYEPDGTAYPGLWPPRVKGMPEGYVRCRECYQALPKSPRCAWKSDVG